MSRVGKTLRVSILALRSKEQRRCYLSFNASPIIKPNDSPVPNSFNWASWPEQTARTESWEAAQLPDTATRGAFMLRLPQPLASAPSDQPLLRVALFASLSPDAAAAAGPAGGGGGVSSGDTLDELLALGAVHCHEELVGKLLSGHRVKATVTLEPRQADRFLARSPTGAGASNGVNKADEAGWGGGHSNSPSGAMSRSYDRLPGGQNGLGGGGEVVLELAVLDAGDLGPLLQHQQPPGGQGQGASGQVGEVDGVRSSIDRGGVGGAGTLFETLVADCVSKQDAFGRLGRQLDAAAAQRELMSLRLMDAEKRVRSAQEEISRLQQLLEQEKQSWRIPQLKVLANAAMLTREELIARCESLTTAYGRERARNGELVERLRLLHSEQVDTLELKKRYQQLQEAHVEQARVLTELEIQEAAAGADGGGGGGGRSVRMAQLQATVKTQEEVIRNLETLLRQTVEKAKQQQQHAAASPRSLQEPQPGSPSPWSPGAGSDPRVGSQGGDDPRFSPKPWAEPGPETETEAALRAQLAEALQRLQQLEAELEGSRQRADESGSLQAAGGEDPGPEGDLDGGAGGSRLSGSGRGEGRGSGAGEGEGQRLQALEEELAAARERAAALESELEESRARIKELEEQAPDPAAASEWEEAVRQLQSDVASLTEEKTGALLRAEFAEDAAEAAKEELTAVTKRAAREIAELKTRLAEQEARAMGAYGEPDPRQPRSGAGSGSGAAPSPPPPGSSPIPRSPPQPQPQPRSPDLPGAAAAAAPASPFPSGSPLQTETMAASAAAAAAARGSSAGAADRLAEFPPPPLAPDVSPSKGAAEALPPLPPPPPLPLAADGTPPTGPRQRKRLSNSRDPRRPSSVPTGDGSGDAAAGLPVPPRPPSGDPAAASPAARAASADEQMPYREGGNARGSGSGSGSGGGSHRRVSGLGAMSGSPPGSAGGRAAATAAAAPPGSAGSGSPVVGPRGRTNSGNGGSGAGSPSASAAPSGAARPASRMASPSEPSPNGAMLPLIKSPNTAGS